MKIDFGVKVKVDLNFHKFTSNEGMTAFKKCKSLHISFAENDLPGVSRIVSLPESGSYSMATMISMQNN